MNSEWRQSASGLSETDMIVPFIGTFLTFSDYMRNAVRLASLSHVQVIYQFTHDSVFLGEDGPTHQPIEHLAALRAMPNLHVIRPADVWEVKMAWIAALRYRGPTALDLIASKSRLNSLAAMWLMRMAWQRRLHREKRIGQSPSLHSLRQDPTGRSLWMSLRPWKKSENRPRDFDAMLGNFRRAKR